MLSTDGVMTSKEAIPFTKKSKRNSNQNLRKNKGNWQH